MAIKSVKLSRYAPVLYAFKINYHPVFQKIFNRYRCSKSKAFKLRFFIAAGLVVNKLIIYE